MKILQSFAFAYIMLSILVTKCEAQPMAYLYDHAISNSNIEMIDDTPLAGDDHAMVVVDNSIIFEALENDAVNGELLDIFISEQPLSGKVSVNDDYSFTYIPKKGSCELVDSFTYVVTNENGKDKATVYVDVICQEITIINGFSPDGDGFNDSFTIIGADNFPDNNLYIFNQWGEEILSFAGYENDWSGDGFEKEMYFYIFEDGVGEVYSGYVNIN